MGNTVAFDRIPLELEEVLGIDVGTENLGSNSPGLTARNNVDASIFSSHILLWRFFTGVDGDGGVKNAPLRFDSLDKGVKFEGTCCYLLLHIYKFIGKTGHPGSRNGGTF